MRAILNRTGTTAIALAWGFLGCSQPASETATDSVSPRALSAGNSIELTNIALKQSLVFRYSGAKIRADGMTHQLDLDPDGAHWHRVAGSGRGQLVEASMRSLLGAKDQASYRRAQTALKRTLKRESPELSLNTISVARSGYECIKDGGRVSITADGVAERRFESCSEIWKNGETTAEQSFRFAQRPEGKGDLVIRVRARVGDKVPSSVTNAVDGLLLMGPTGERYRYGHGHWIDAAGQHLEVPARFTGDVIELQVPEATIDSASYPAVLDPVVGPELDTDAPVSGPTTLGSYPTLASNGSGFLAVQSVNGRIRAVRVDGNGNVLDLPWIDFGESLGNQYYPNVTYGNGHYLVSWAQFGADDLVSTDDSVHARFVKSDGTLEGAANFQLAGSSALYPKLVWDGTHYLGAWLGLSGAGDNNIRSALFNADGSMVAGTERAVSLSGNTTDPTIVLGANQALVAWDDYSQSSTYVVNAARVGADGMRKDTTPLVVSPTGTSSKDVALGSNGSSFLVTWNTDSGNYAVRGAIVNDAGTIVANDFAISHSTGTAALPTVDFDGTNYLVAWADSRDSNSIYGVNVSPTGVVASGTDSKLAAGSPTRAYPGSMDKVSLSYNGARHLVSFLGSGIEGSLVEKNLSIVNGKIALTALVNPQGYPRVAYDGQNYVVAWTDERNGSTSSMLARGVRISGSGDVLDPAGLSITPEGAFAYDVSIASVGNQTSQLFYVQSGAAPNQRTLSSDGTLNPPKAFGTAAQSGNPNVASNGTTYLATTIVSSSSTGTVSGRILDASGNPGTEFTIGTTTLNTGTSIVPTKGGYLVLYSNSGARLVTVSDTGQVGTSSLFNASSLYIAGASSSTETLVVWSNMTDYNAYGRFYKDGAFTGNQFTIASGTLGYTPAIAWDGTNYLVVWEVDQHNLVGRTVSSTGSLGAAYTLVGDNCGGPALASNGQGQVLLSYAKYGYQWLNRRVHSRLITQTGTTNVPLATAGAAGMSSQGGGSGGTAQGGTSNTATGGTTTTSAGGSGGTATNPSTGGTNTTATGTTGGTNSNQGGSNQGGSNQGGSNQGGSNQGGSTATTLNGVGGSTSTGATASTGTTSQGGTNGTTTTTGSATGSTATTATTLNAVNQPAADGGGGCRMSPSSKPSRPWLALVIGALATMTLRRRRPGV